MVTLADGASVDAVVRDARLPAPKLRYDTALTGFAADLNGPQLERVLADPAVAAVEPDAEVSAMGMQALAPGETVPPGVRRAGGATPALAHAPATTRRRGPRHGRRPRQPRTSTPSPASTASSRARRRRTTTATAPTSPGSSPPATPARASSASRRARAVYAVKVLNNRAVGTLSQFLCGINWVAANAAAQNIRVANMSIGGVGLSDGACGTISGDSEHKAICAAAAAGVTFVVSAGNGGTDFARTVPAAYPEVLTATAITDTDGLPGALGPASCAKKELDDRAGTYSSYAVSAAAAAHAVAAPGTCVTSAGIGGKASTYTGTSQAAPHVAGAVALCHGSGGLPGPCAGLAPAAVIARVRADATGGDDARERLLGRPAAPADRQGLRAAGHRRLLLGSGAMPKIVTLPGDGIGPEVLDAALRVLGQVAPDLDYEEHEFGGASIDAHGTALTDEVLAACRAADAVLLGAVGGPKWDTTDPDAPRPEQGLLGLRKGLGLYANLRPVRPLAGALRRQPAAARGDRAHRPARRARAHRRHLLRRQGPRERQRVRRVRVLRGARSSGSPAPPSAPRARA